MEGEGGEHPDRSSAAHRQQTQEAGQDEAKQERKDAQAGGERGDKKKGHFLCEERGSLRTVPLLRSVCTQCLDLPKATKKQSSFSQLPNWRVQMKIQL